MICAVESSTKIVFLLLKHVKPYFFVCKSGAMPRVTVTFEVSVKDAKPEDKVFVVGGETTNVFVP